MDKIHWTRRGSTGDLDRIQQAFQEIKRIFQTLEARDPVAAAAAMHNHISNTAEFRKTKAKPKKTSVAAMPRVKEKRTISRSARLHTLAPRG